MSENPSSFDRFNNWINGSITLKLISVGILILILLIPEGMVSSLISQRESRHNDAIGEITGKWGGKQTITGPVLNLPFKPSGIRSSREDSLGSETLHFLPQVLKISGTLKPEVRYRGIYKAVVYRSVLHIDGSFNAPDYKAMMVSDSQLIMNKSYISLGIPDLRGIKDTVILKWNDKIIAFNPGIDDKDISGSGLSAPIPFSDIKETNTFSIDIELNGSEGINFVPIGKITTVNLQSSWDSPSFDGAFLPDNRAVSSKGFTAGWRILHLNRNYPQQWKGSMFNTENSQFGVKLIIPADVYQQTTRSAKYAVLLISLSFLIFFFVEILNHLRIHPLQYLLVGIALCIFYTLLLSISEFIPFGYTYLISSIATIGLITAYSVSIFRSVKFAVLYGGLLALLYLFIYIIVRLEDTALLIGSIGLFIILALLMYLSRKIKWYKEPLDRNN